MEPPSFDRGASQVIAPFDQLDDRPDEGEDRGQRQVGGGATDLHADAARLDDSVVVGVGVGELFGGEGERDRPAFARLEADAPEAAQLEDGPGDGRLLVADVQLDDLVPGSRAGVRRRRRGSSRRPRRGESVRSSAGRSSRNVVYERPCPNGQSGATGPST